MTATDTEAALLAAIRENPGEDAPRLVLADWLEENAETAACAACKGRVWPLVPPPDVIETVNTFGVVTRYAKLGPFKAVMPCSACHGTGRVSDGRKELSEFIRVQCELATDQEPCNEWCNNGLNTCDECRNRDRLRARECELWGYLPTRNGARSYFESTLPGAAFCPESDGGKHLGSGFPIVLIQRGLPALVRCTLAEWIGGECGQCQGRGQRTIYGDGSGPWTKCQYCVDGLTPGIGPRLAQRWPIERVEVTDKRPVLVDGNRRHDKYVGRWIWWQGDDGGEENNGTLPRSIIPEKYRNRVWNFDSEPAARAALSDALIAWARG